MRPVLDGAQPPDLRVAVEGPGRGLRQVIAADLGFAEAEADVEVVQRGQGVVAVADAALGVGVAQQVEAVVADRPVAGRASPEFADAGPCSAKINSAAWRDWLFRCSSRADFTSASQCTCAVPHLTVTINTRKYHAEPSETQGLRVVSAPAECQACGGSYDGPWQCSPPGLVAGQPAVNQGSDDHGQRGGDQPAANRPVTRP